MFHYLGREASNEVLFDVGKQIRHSRTPIFGVASLCVAFFDFNIIFFDVNHIVSRMPVRRKHKAET